VAFVSIEFVELSSYPHSGSLVLVALAIAWAEGDILVVSEDKSVTPIPV